MSILVRNGLLVTQDESRRVIEGNLYAEDGRILEVAGPERSADLVLDAEGCIVLPGLINCFTRASDILLGPPRDTSVEVTLERMETLRRRLTRRDVQLAAALASAEMLLQGTTTFLDVCQWEEEVARAVTQVGGRGFLSWLVVDPEDLNPCDKHLSHFRSWERIVPLIGPASMDSVELLEQVEALAKERGTKWCLSLSESRGDVYRFQRKMGVRPVEWLEKMGLLSPNLIALQGVWLTMNEIRSVARADVKVVHCPVSNQMKGMGGPMALLEMLEEGVTVGLGTDSPAVCGTTDLFRHMRACALLHKGQKWDATAVPAQLLLDLCTVKAAEVLGLDGGSLRKGNIADLTILSPRWRLPHDASEEALSYMVHLAEGMHVRDVIVGGKLVVENGILKTLDVEGLREDIDTLRMELGHEESGH